MFFIKSHQAVFLLILTFKSTLADKNTTQQNVKANMCPINDKLIGEGLTEMLDGCRKVTCVKESTNTTLLIIKSSGADQIYFNDDEKHCSIDVPNDGTCSKVTKECRAFCKFENQTKLHGDSWFIEGCRRATCFAFEPYNSTKIEIEQCQDIIIVEMTKEQQDRGCVFNENFDGFYPVCCRPWVECNGVKELNQIVRYRGMYDE
ncbi:uncharacterized protein LOC106668123 [Cimex lectularius]|uniref:Single domain-containing protein n=1 Tax=Cimex lectularius TaxID=79782 RepID=A0A8I6RUX1_CIMLE|nr:uncharacterized protein LOC106668123 [Cimex lectularius]